MPEADETLLRAWRHAAREIADRAFRMGLARTAREALKELRQIRDILRDLDRASARYVQDLIDEVWRQADAKTIEQLGRRGIEPVNDDWTEANDEGVKHLALATIALLAAATAGIGRRAEELFQRGRMTARLERLAGGGSMLSAGIAEEVRGQLTRGIVQITGRDGVSRQYMGDGYAGLVADHARQQAMSQGALYRISQNGEDLTMVSANFSLIGDFCDAYRGRVYSISGTHPVAPPLAALPNGGPPLHPRCLHVLQPWIAEFEGEERTAARMVTDPRFLYVDARLANKRWKGLSGAGQAKLRHAPDRPEAEMANLFA